MIRRILPYLSIAAFSLAVSPAILTVTPAMAETMDKPKVHLPEYYWGNVRSMFKKNQWEKGKALLDQGMKIYPDASSLNELMGQYYYHHKQYDKSRYYLIHAIKEDNENVFAKQILVNVEEETGNYSSAICYVNELLEVNPYWQGLWRRKILLYRKQGNDVEADRLLKRINQIYPNDKKLQRDYAYSLEQNYLKYRNSDKTKAVSALREMVNNNLAQESHYMALSNLLLQQGKDEEAAQVAGAGAEKLKSSSLAAKKAGIIAEQGRYTEAMGYVQRWQRSNNSASLSNLYNDLLEESASSAAQQDPYTLYGKLYEQKHSSDALTYLLNTSYARNYNEDALYYINEAKKRGVGKLPNLQYREYMVRKRMGDLRGAENLINKLYQTSPNNSDILEEMVLTRLDLANERMQTGEYDEAVNYLDFCAKNAQDRETQEVSLRKLYNCYYNLKRYKKALATLDVINELYPMPTTADILKRASALEAMEEQPKALTLLKEAIAKSDDDNRPALIEAYEENAIPYIKKLQEEGATQSAYREAQALLEYVPTSNQGLRYAINLASQQKDYQNLNYYIMQGRTNHPGDIFFIVKQAEQYGRIQNHQAALELLQGTLKEYPNNEMVRGAYSEQSELRTLQLLKEHNDKDAMAVIDQALLYDENNRQLLYTKGLVYESRHEYDSAHYYQKFYQPTPIETPEMLRHLNSLLNRGYRNEVTVSYLQSRYTEDIITSVASIAYQRKEDKYSWGITTNYAGREGDADKTTTDYQLTGGMGFQIIPNFEYNIDDLWTVGGNVGWASKYFPKFTFNAEVTRHLKNDWNVAAGIGYRRLNSFSKTWYWDQNTYDWGVDRNESVEVPNGWLFNGWEASGKNMFQLSLSADKTLNNFWFNSKLLPSMMGSKFFINWVNQARFFPSEDGVSYVNVMASIGTAPEASLIDYALPSSFSHFNALVGLSGQLLVHRNVSLGLMGTWSTYYNQNPLRVGSYTDYTESIETTYRNIFTVQLEVHVRF